MVALIEIPVPAVRVLRDLVRAYIDENTVLFDGDAADCRGCRADLLLDEPHRDGCPVQAMIDFLATL